MQIVRHKNDKKMKVSYPRETFEKMTNKGSKIKFSTKTHKNRTKTKKKLMEDSVRVLRAEIRLTIYRSPYIRMLCQLVD